MKMYNTVEIGGKTIELAANAATPYRIKQIFGIDLMKVFFSAEKDGGLETSEILPQLTYIMNMQALHKDMNKLNMDSFLDWCEGFGAMDIANAGESIINVYIGTMQTTSSSKKK